MDLHTPVCDLLCCDVPIVLAGMGGVARSELVAAVTEAGGFGFLGMVMEPRAKIQAEIEAVRARSQRPFGVNLVPAATPPALLADQVEACIEAKVHAVALFWDLAPGVVARLREAGVLVVCQIGSVAEAKAARDAGADILIAQGWQAGGHVRGVTALASLVPAVVSQVDIPVLAAGGICDGAALAAAMIQGAQGGVLGTAFLATEESFAHDYYKRRVAEASSDVTIYTDAFHRHWPAGAHVRVLPNSVTRGERGDPFGFHRDVIGADGERPIHLFGVASPLRTTTGDLEAMPLYAGQGIGRISAIVPAAERLRDIAREATAILRPGPARDASSPVPAQEVSSAPCYAHGASATYMGFAERDELIAELNTLLEAERAGARVAARLVTDAAEPDLRDLARLIHADELRWCRELFAALVGLKAEPSLNVGGFYENAMAIKDVKARLAFVNRGQGWVVRKLRELSPRVRDDGLHATLRRMLEAHQANIARTEETLVRGAGAAPAPPT